MGKGLWIGLGTLGLLAAGSAYGLYRLATTYYDFGPAAAELPEAAKSYRAVGLPFVAKDVAPPHPSPAKDATPSLRAALRLFPKKADKGELTKAARNPGPAADPIVARYAPALARLDPTKPSVDFRRDWDRGPYILFPEYADMKYLARAATVRAVRSAQKGDDAKALADLRLARQLALWAEQEPTLISMLVRIACESIVLEGAQHCLAAAKGDAKRIAAYATWLRTAPQLPSFRYALHGEAWYGVTTARNLDLFGGTRNFERQMPKDLEHLRRDGFPPGQRERGFMTRVLQAWAEAAKETDDFRQSPIEVGRKMDALEERWSEKKGLSRTLVAILFPVFGKAGEAIVKLHAKRAVTLGLAEALDAQARTGRWPTSVSQKDPFDGKPLRVKAGKDFRVYSVDRDLKDQGGLHRREAPKTKGATFDEVAAYPPVP